MTILANLISKIFRIYNNKIVKSNNKTNEIFKKNFKSKKLKNIKSKISIYINIKVIKELIFLNFSIRKNFNYLKQAFIKALIF